ncbi:hypothetical protein [Kitasatospora sp. NPDC001547]|uniref:hypothetical protein n=1 Tax=Kitasatospora sp. NPDC001547 TaxID=3364015 RepID=UPI0036BD45E0
MHPIAYLAGVVLAALVVVATVATPLFLAHARERDHGPACWWCHPGLRRRR